MLEKRIYFISTFFFVVRTLSELLCLCLGGDGGCNYLT